MGLLLHAQGKLEEAELDCREGLERRRRVRGDEHPDTLISIASLGGILVALGRAGEAIELLAPAEPAARREFTGGNSIRLGRFLTALGRARIATEELDAAEANLTEAYALVEQSPGATTRDRADALSGLVELYEARHAADPGKGYDAKAAEWRLKSAE
jgi:hypothetical protein